MTSTQRPVIRRNLFLRHHHRASPFLEFHSVWHFSTSLFRRVFQTTVVTTPLMNNSIFYTGVIHKIENVHTRAICRRRSVTTDFGLEIRICGRFEMRGGKKKSNDRYTLPGCRVTRQYCGWMISYTLTSALGNVGMRTCRVIAKIRPTPRMSPWRRHKRNRCRFSTEFSSHET